MKNILKKIWIPVVIVLIAAAYFFMRGSGSAEIAFQTQAVERGNLVATVGATGTVRARQSITLLWQTTGSVDKVSASVGDHVAAGTVLASLSPTSVSQNIILAQADLVNAQKNLADLLASDTVRVQAQIALRKAQEAYDKAVEYREELEDGMLVTIRGQKEYIEADEETIAKADEQVALTGAQLEDAQRAYDRVKDGPNPEDIAAAQARVNAAQATLNLARIITPFDGTITDARPLTGDQVTTGTMGFRVDDLSSLLVDVEISEVDVNSVAVGQPVSLTFDAILGKEYHGEVTQVSQAGVIAQGVVNFTVTVKIIDADEFVKPGMTAAVTITIQELKDQVLIPNRAVRLIDGKRVVYILRNGLPEKVEVRLGSSSDTHSVLLGGEVNVGDEIILNPPAEFQGGPGGGGPFGG